VLRKNEYVDSQVAIERIEEEPAIFESYHWVRFSHGECERETENDENAYLVEDLHEVVDVVCHRLDFPVELSTQVGSVQADYNLVSRIISQEYYSHSQRHLPEQRDCHPKQTIFVEIVHVHVQRSKSLSKLSRLC
jgi:hypothetical protein